jgi:hypothetical protein
MQQRRTKGRPVSQGADPDPVAILTIAFAGVGLLSGAAATVIQAVESRRRHREETRSRQERVADVMTSADRVILAAGHLLESINAFERDAALALSFSEQARRSQRLESPKPHFAFGENLISVSGSSREMWDLLVDDVCSNVRLVNRFVLEFTEQLTLLFDRLRLLEAVASVEFERSGIVAHARERAYSFQGTVAKFQALTSKTPLPRASQVFGNLCNKGRELVLIVEGMVERLRRMLH